MTENEYINVKALGHISSALSCLKNVIPEIVDCIDVKEYRQATKILCEYEAKLFLIIKIEE